MLPLAGGHPILEGSVKTGKKAAEQSAAVVALAVALAVALTRLAVALTL